MWPWFPALRYTSLHSGRDDAGGTGDGEVAPAAPTTIFQTLSGTNHFWAAALMSWVVSLA